MQAKIRWGIIAPGRIANRFAQGFADIGDGYLQGVASRDKRRAEEFANQYQIPTVFEDYQTLIESPEIDAIYIASPHRYHFDTVKACLNHKKAVLCEKPLTVTAKQSEALFSLANEQQTFLMEALWTRFLPIWQQVKAWVSDGEIGELVTLNSSFGFKPPKDETDRLFSLDLAGGAMLDTGVYCIALSQFIIEKEPVNVHSSVVVGDTGVDEKCSVLLDYGQITSQFTCTFLAELENRFEIHGTEGKIVVDGCFWDASKATLSKINQTPITKHLPQRASGFEYQVDEVHQCLIEGQTTSDNMSPTATINTMKVMDTILENAGVRYPFAPRD
ncbi:Gfo/Idh/MocA family oxidoreductase [Vibrio sp. SCSIO 43136]|uniref:Gfo/Idh/MocA family protein n=1 Tax=Vibrio sp. SCSIO 43136 TaxID=2819101 RepID=UPI002074DC09|nr:Gfo/Idh/MocA family oxidoreductase [Vibrio sp. SCSIO 43136]USD67946.1 Gfo/Idh/MocA family oxidoreductase [Vibrio sp. SCSIO 43136]